MTDGPYAGMDMTREDLIAQGRQAALAGLSRDANPYGHMAVQWEHDCWDRGWREQSKQESTP